jgi:hypothetical protein
MKLFQYWDAPVPPADVQQLIEGFRINNPEFEHVLLNETTADEFIAQHYGPREVRAFRACAVPAMQADLIRLCVMDAVGGIYVDVDNQSVRPLADLIAPVPHALMATALMGQLNNSFLMFRRPHHPFIRACIDLVVENIEKRRFRCISTASGPAVMSAVRATIAPQYMEDTLLSFDIPVAGLETRFPELVEVAQSRSLSPEFLAAWKSGIKECADNAAWAEGLNATLATGRNEFLELLEHARSLIAPDPELVAALNAITIVDTLQMSPWVFAAHPGYKQTDRHWLAWKGSIYRTPRV